MVKASDFSTWRTNRLHKFPMSGGARTSLILSDVWGSGWPTSMGSFHEAIYFNKKCSELFKQVAVEMETCCRRIEVIGAVLSGDIIYFCM